MGKLTIERYQEIYRQYNLSNIDLMTDDCVYIKTKEEILQKFKDAGLIKDDCKYEIRWTGEGAYSLWDSGSTNEYVILAAETILDWAFDEKIDTNIFYDLEAFIKDYRGDSKYAYLVFGRETQFGDDIYIDTVYSNEQMNTYQITEGNDKYNNYYYPSTREIGDMSEAWLVEVMTDIYEQQNH